MKISELIRLNESELLQNAIPGFWIFPDGKTIEGIPIPSYHLQTIQDLDAHEAEYLGLDWEKIKDDPVQGAIDAGFIRGSHDPHGNLNIHGNANALKRASKLLIQAINDPDIFRVDIDRDDAWKDFGIPEERQNAINFIMGKPLTR